MMSLTVIERAKVALAAITLLIFMTLVATNFAVGIEDTALAPMYALSSAVMLCVNYIPDRSPEEKSIPFRLILNEVIVSSTGLSAVLTAHYWLRSENVGNPAWILVEVVLVVVAIVSLNLGVLHKAMPEDRA